MTIFVNKSNKYELITTDNFHQFIKPILGDEKHYEYDLPSLKSAYLAYRVFGGEIYSYKHDFSHLTTFSNLIDSQMFEFTKDVDDQGNMARMSRVENFKEFAEKNIPDLDLLIDNFEEVYMEMLMHYRDNF